MLPRPHLKHLLASKFNLLSLRVTQNKAQKYPLPKERSRCNSALTVTMMITWGMILKIGIPVSREELAEVFLPKTQAAQVAVEVAASRPRGAKRKESRQYRSSSPLSRSFLRFLSQMKPYKKKSPVPHHQAKYNKKLKAKPQNRIISNMKPQGEKHPVLPKSHSKI